MVDKYENRGQTTATSHNNLMDELDEEDTLLVPDPQETQQTFGFNGHKRPFSEDTEVEFQRKVNPKISSASQKRARNSNFSHLPAAAMALTEPSTPG